MELRHAKDQFELEMVSFEQVNTKQISQENRIAQLKLKQMNEMHTEKEATLVKHETAKEEWLRAMHDKELRNLAKAQKNSLEKLILSQQSIMEAKKEATNSALSVIEPKLDLITSMATEEETNTEAEMLMEVADSITSASSADEVRIMTGKASIHEALQVLVMRHNAEMFALEADIQQDIMVCQENFEALKVKMHKDQKEECIALLRSQEKEISELKQVQDKEIQMEESMHDSEMKMLVERRILNSVLETVADGNFILIQESLILPQMVLWCVLIMLPS